MAFAIIQYYKYVAVPNVAQEVAAQRAIAQELGLLGRIYVAPEGINGTVSGSQETIARYKAYSDAHPLFAGMLFKEDPVVGHAFVKLVVRAKPEIVAFRSPVEINPAKKTGRYVSPEEFQAVLEGNPSDVILLDARSSYEVNAGYFRGAQWLDVDNFRELPQQLEALQPHADKRIITYCTGGVKCEKLTALMLELGFERPEQLHGGILNYAKATGGKGFEGVCYVFDDRVTVPVNTVDPSTVGRCQRCDARTNTFVNCANTACHKRMMLCDACAATYAGTCSEACYTAVTRRAWNGTGLYHRAGRTSDVQAERTAAEK